ncbi:hypothetical protein FS837_003095 [Tulasnella sp. UAMH 9824]|nr:hypothetical protein FS837_003095 [Tulasnella sp. UAMH 9824]
MPQPDLRVETTKTAKRERKREAHETTLASLGRNLGHFYQMYGSSKAALLQLFEVDDLESDPLERRLGSSNFDPQLATLLKWMLSTCPSLAPMMEEAAADRDPGAALNRLARPIDQGWSEARNTDTGTLKNAVAANFGIEPGADEFGDWTPRLTVTGKDNWGLNHPQLSVLMTPVHDPPMTDEDIAKLRQPGCLVPCDKWYPWMWEGRNVDLADLELGLLKGDILTKAWLITYFGSALKPKHHRIIAVKEMGFSRTTTHSIAYVATLMRFVLSNERRIDDGFDSSGFYCELLRFLEHPDQAEFTSGLLDWWDKNVFPSSIGDRQNTSVIGEGGTWALLKKKRAEKGAQRPRYLPPAGTTVHATVSSHSPTPDTPPASPSHHQSYGPNQPPIHPSNPAPIDDDSVESEDDDVARQPPKKRKVPSLRVQSEEEGEAPAQSSKASKSTAALKKQPSRRGGANGANQGARSTRSRTGNDGS